jgi:hypothetical protein
VWPHATRRGDFERAIESYALAAADVDGLLLPVAAAWLEAWERDPAIELYAADGLHPSVAGSYLAALVMYSVIVSKSPVGLPRGVRLRNGEIVEVGASVAAQLQSAAARVIGHQ